MLAASVDLVTVLEVLGAIALILFIFAGLRKFF